MKLIPEEDFPELQRHPGNGIWYVRKFVKGKGELFRSTRERKSKAKAKNIALKILTDFMGSPVKGHVVLFSHVSAEVMRLKASKSEATQNEAHYQLELRVDPWFGGYRIDQVNEALIEDYWAECRAKNPTGKLFHDWKMIVSVMRRAYFKGLIPRPLQIKKPDQPTADKHVFSPEEEIELLKNARPRLRLQILIGLRMGMRPGEILRLRKNQIDETNGLIKLEWSDVKTRRERSVPIHPDVAHSLSEAIKKAPGSYLFGNRENKSKPPTRNANRPSFERLKVKCKINNGTLHDLRRTCATRMGMSKLPPAMACKILGMSLATFLKIYCKPTATNLRDSYLENFSEPVRVISGNEIDQGEEDE